MSATSSATSAMAVYAPPPNPANVPPYGIWTTPVLYSRVDDYWKHPTQPAGVMVPVPGASTSAPVSAPVSAPTDQVGVASVRPRPTSNDARQASPDRVRSVDDLRKRGGVFARLGNKGKIGKNRVSYRPNHSNPNRDLNKVNFTHEVLHFMPYKVKALSFRKPRDDDENNRIAVVGDSQAKKLWRRFLVKYPNANVQFFGRGGAKLGVTPGTMGTFIKEYMDAIVQWKPYKVFIWVGGNDFGTLRNKDFHYRAKVTHHALLDLKKEIEYHCGAKSTVVICQGDRDNDWHLSPVEFHNTARRFNTHIRDSKFDHWVTLPVAIKHFGRDNVYDRPIRDPRGGVHYTEKIYDQILDSLQKYL